MWCKLPAGVGPVKALLLSGGHMPSYFQIVDGVRLPARLGGHPALDFCNTWAGWDGTATGDYLTTFRELAIWAAFVGIVSHNRVGALCERADAEPASATAVLRRARRFRANFYDVVRDRSTNSPHSSWTGVEEELRKAVKQCVLRPRAEGFRWDVAESAGLSAPLHAAAWSAAQLLTSPELADVRACPGTGCGWLFLDPHGRRRWCSMAACGNRAKVRRFAAREREK
jgi:predicted RNA-binding Zn ribbon-like protein